MESIYAIAGGLALRVALSTIARIHSPFSDHALSYKNDLSSTLANIDSASRSSLRLTSALVGVWEGVVTLHFLKKMPNSFDPYIAYGVRLFIDLIVTESLERLVVVVIWTVLGMIMADVAPPIWKEMGLHRIWRRTRRDLYKITKVVEKSVPRMRFRVPALPKVRVVRFGEDHDREQRELEREQRRRERRERRRGAEEEEIEDEEPVRVAPQPVPATSILRPPPSTIESTVPTTRRRASPSSELASILELGSNASVSATPTPLLVAESTARRSRDWEPEPQRVKERERVPIGLPTPSNTTVTAPSRSYHRYEPEPSPEPSEDGTASPALSSTSTNDLTLEVDYDPQLDDDNRSSVASYTAASSPQFTSASNLTPRIDLLSPPGSDMMDYIGLPDESATPQYQQQEMGHKLQFLDTAIDNAPEVDAEEELMSDYAAEEEMLAIAGGSSRYEDEMYDFEYEEDRAATPKPRRNPYLPPTPSDSAPFGRRTFAKRDLPRETSSIFSNEPTEEVVVVPPTALLQQIPDDVEKEEPPKEEVKDERPPTPPAKDESYRATPPPAAAARLRSSSSKKAASALGAPTSSTEKLKRSSKSKSKSVVSEGVSTPQLASFIIPATPERKLDSPAPVKVEQLPVPAVPISVATAGLKPPSGPVGFGLMTPISADRSAGNIPAPPRGIPSYAPFNIPPPGTPTLLDGFGNPGVPGPDASRVGSRGLPPAYVDWTGSDYGQEMDDEEDDMYLDEQTSKIQIELFKRKEEEERKAQDLIAQQAAQNIFVHRMQQQTPDQTFAVDTAAPASPTTPLVSSPVAESPLPSPITPFSPLAPNSHISSRPKDRKGRSGIGSIENKKTDPVKNLVSHWNALGDAPKSKGGKSYSDIGMIGSGAGVKRSTSSAGHASSKSVVGGGSSSTRPPVLRRTSTPITPNGISPVGFAAGVPLPASVVGSTLKEKGREEEEKRRANEEAARVHAERERAQAEAAAAAAEEQARIAREEEEFRLEEARRIKEEERRVREEEQRLAEEAQRLRDEEQRLAEEARRLREQEAAERREAEERAQKEAAAEAEKLRLEAIRVAEEEAEAKRLKKEEKKRKRAEERARKEAEEAEERRRKEEEAAEKERLRLAAMEAERERQRLAQEEADRQRQRLAEEEAERERQRLVDEEAERERQRLVEEEAERERQRLAEEAEQERQRLLAEEEAERERVRLEEEQLRIQREKDEEEERARKAREKEQERQWKLEHAERKTELAAAASEVKRTASVVSAAGSRISKVDKDKDLPPPPGAAIEEPVAAPTSAFGEGLDISWRPQGDQKPTADADDEIGNPWDTPADNRPRTPTQETVNMAGIGAGGRSEVGRSVVGQEKVKSPSPEKSPEIEVKSASENQYASARDGEGEEDAVEEEEDANEPEGLHAPPDDLASVSVVTDATEVSQEVEKRLRKALSLRAQKAELDHQLQALQAKPDAGADEIKAAERVVRKYEKKIRRLYEDCQAQSFFYPSAAAASAILLQGISPELARDHINEALLWHLTPEARSLSFTVSLPPKIKKTSAAEKAMRAATLLYIESELKLSRTPNPNNKKLHTVAVEPNRWDEWIAALRRASTSADS